MSSGPNTLIHILGAPRSGTTMLDLMLGNDDDESFSMGEVYAWFRPFRTHHFKIRCHCGDTECAYWKKIREHKESEFHKKAFSDLEVRFLVDSSKDLAWVIDSNLWARQRNVKVVNILIYKPFQEYAHSIWKRGESLDVALENYKQYYSRFFETKLPAYSINYRELVENPEEMLEILCELTGQKNHPARKKFWKHESHHLFGSGGVTRQLRNDKPGIDASINYSGEFLDTWNAFQKKLLHDDFFSELTKKLKEIDVHYHHHQEVRIDDIQKPAWYYFLKWKNKFKSVFPEKLNNQPSRRLENKFPVIKKIRSWLGKVYHWVKREILGRVKRIFYILWLRYKQFSFNSREERIHLFDEILRNNPEIYFTTDLVKTGFTDQLIGFSFLYKMGRGLGLIYYHTPLSTHRSSIPFLMDPLSKDEITRSRKNESKNAGHDIFDFLGVNSALKKLSGNLSDSSKKEVYIDLNLILPEKGEINNFESLIREMKAILYPFLKKNQRVVLTFGAKPKTYFKFYRYTVSQKEHEIDFRKHFEQIIAREKYTSVFEEATLNMMVHIRQGDTGTVKTPWNTYIPTWYSIEEKFTQFSQNEDIPNSKRIDPEEFYRFLEKLFSVLNPDLFSTRVYSDGYKKAFRWIYMFSVRKHISAKQIEQLKELEPEYDERIFGKFETLPGVKNIIGEDIEKLHDLIYSFIEADILLVGTQGLMIPKLMAMYADRKKMPLMILLYNTKVNVDMIGLHEDADYLIQVDLNAYDIKQVAEKIKRYFKDREMHI